MIPIPASVVSAAAPVRAGIRPPLLALAALLAFLAPRPAAAQFDAGIPVGTPAPRIAINDLAGKPFDLGTVIGKKPVLLEFWASWCAVCKSLLPQLDRVHQTYGDRITMIGVNITVNDSKERVVRYMEVHHPPFMPLFDDKGAGTRAFDVATTSFIVIIDRAGKVVYTGSGEAQDLVKAAALAFQ